MIILLSPSKTLDFDSPFPSVPSTQPAFLSESEKLIGTLRTFSEADLGKLMGISDKLAALNYQRYQDFKTPFTEQNARPCLFTFKGDVYDGLEASTLSAKAIERAQSHLRILSGLYGLLRPYDLMQAYRLEMGTKLQNECGKDLYQFWGDRITEALNKELAGRKNRLVINLASNEYFKAVNVKRLDGELVTPVFKEQKGNQLKVIGLFAKKARGIMTRYILQQGLESIDDLQGFQEAGYRHDSTLSSKNEQLFIRPQPVAA